ncbi:MAG: hypothetical protein LBH76_00340 [Propionibacteriaceae bacterium]|nr:hypothetical protein [Propionibacteriaceae bacterium]
MWRSIGDFGEEGVRGILRRAAELAKGATPEPALRPLVGMVFLEASLRTRTGFAAAAHRLGGAAVDVDARRGSETSAGESVHDTLRTVMGYADVVVARPGLPLRGEVVPDTPTPLINGGDAGEGAEHPSQALLDVFGWQQDGVVLADSAVAVVGDPGMRSAVSLRRLFRYADFRPRQLRIVSTEHLIARSLIREQRDDDDPSLSFTDWAGVADADIVYMCGLPHRAVTFEERDRLRLTPAVMAGLKSTVRITSPLPNVDEISYDVYGDPRLRAFDYSDLALFVRMAILEHALQN